MAARNVPPGVNVRREAPRSPHAPGSPIRLSATQSIMIDDFARPGHILRWKSRPDLEISSSPSMRYLSTCTRLRYHGFVPAFSGVPASDRRDPASPRRVWPAEPRRKVTPLRSSSAPKRALTVMGSPKHQNGPWRRVRLRAGWKLPPSRGSRAVCRHGVQRLYWASAGHELDGLRRGVEHDVERRVRLLDRSEEHRTGSVLPEIPSASSSIACGVSHDTPKEPSGRRPSTQRRARRSEICGAAVSSLTTRSYRFGVAARPIHHDRIILTISIVVAALACPLVCGEHRGHALRETRLAS